MAAVSAYHGVVPSTSAHRLAMKPIPSVHPTSPPPPPAMPSAVSLPPFVVGTTNGPDVAPRWLSSTFGIAVHRDTEDRMRWLSVLTIAGAILGVLFAALGRIPFDLPMPTHAIGVVSPTCGLTRGTVAILRGDPGLAFRYNPGSFAVPLVGLAALIRLALGIFGHDRWLNVRFRPTRTAWIVGAVAFTSWWVYQQSNAIFLMHSHGV